MLFRTLFRDVPSRSPTRPRRPRPPRRGGRSYRPRLDVLEDRCLLSYSVIDIGTFGGTSSSGQAADPHFDYRDAGYAALPGGTFHAFWYEGGPKRDLGTLCDTTGCGRESFGYGTNGGKVVGSSDLPGNQVAHAFLWSFPDGMTMTDLLTLGGANSSARGINDSGQVVGFSDTTGSLSSHAFLWTSPGPMTDLGTLGGTNSNATAINSASPIQVVGSSNPSGSFNSHAFLWTSPGPMTDLGTLGGANSYGQGINLSGQVVGFSNPLTSFNSHAFRWTSAGGMTDLGTLGGTDSYAFGINASGLVVGDSFTPSNALHAFLYNGTVMQDLNNLIPPSSGWELTVANAISDSGQIVGTGRINGENHAFLLTPAPGGGGGGRMQPRGPLQPHAAGSPIQAGPSQGHAVATPKTRVPLPSRASSGGSALVAALPGATPFPVATTLIVPQTPNGPPAAPSFRPSPSPALGTVGDPAPPANLGGGQGHGTWSTATARPAPGGADAFFADLGQGFRQMDGAPPWA